MKNEISIDIEGNDLSVDVEAYAYTAVLRFGDLSIIMSSDQFWMLRKEMRRWILEDDEVARLPERLSRDQAEPICSLLCKGECFGDCDCNSEVQKAWLELRRRLTNENT